MVVSTRSPAAGTGGSGSGSGGSAGNGKNRATEPASPLPRGSDTGGPSAGGAPDDAEWPHGGGLVAASLPRATIQQIDTLDHQVGDLTDQVGRVSDRVDRMADTMEDTKGSVEGVRTEVTAVTSEVQHLVKIVQQLVPSGVGPASARAGSFLQPVSSTDDHRSAPDAARPPGGVVWVPRWPFGMGVELLH